MKRLIVSGDDFGLHSSINEAIEESFQKGILTSASLVVNGEAVEEAIRIAKRNPGLGIGLHLTLIEEKPLIQSKYLAPNGIFPSNHNQLAQNIILGKIPMSEIIAEFEAQISYIKANVENFTHLDSHRHMHMLPKLWHSVVKLSKKYEVNKIRYVDVPFFDFRKDQIFKDILASGFKFVRYFRKGLISPDSFLGFMESGNWSEDKFINLLNKFHEGIWEVGMHPGSSDKKLKLKFPEWDTYYDYPFSWEKEMKTITSIKVKDAIEACNIQLVSFKEI
ncbi:carbohydrate deacetylase [Leptospira levettii]|uniref:ChbG/HpnK family deacetylase n=1 Tax=Leptospira levettii TaxID=2023178 RepID=A0AAW5VDC1_9LEPT|nr:ChbG/HpnK family deacetylase [Leptospira levettii]MCW7466215.1 ChbG/HpnK family deacetylase [Leptospira levettii]MCW7512260.1 ChbG/HpnK family deacetylase [Leptospira levettii]MCW7516268.1 ChbG/HpnK family deacetylase [Leptospira levettii]